MRSLRKNTLNNLALLTEYFTCFFVKMWRKGIKPSKYKNPTFCERTLTLPSYTGDTE